MALGVLAHMLSDKDVIFYLFAGLCFALPLLIPIIFNGDESFPSLLSDW